eukprot:3661077-Pyramimonas_sp.AAC.1
MCCTVHEGYKRPKRGCYRRGPLGVRRGCAGGPRRGSLQEVRRGSLQGVRRGCAGGAQRVRRGSLVPAGGAQGVRRGCAGGPRRSRAHIPATIAKRRGTKPPFRSGSGSGPGFPELAFVAESAQQR